MICRYMRKKKLPVALWGVQPKSAIPRRARVGCAVRLRQMLQQHAYGELVSTKEGVVTTKKVSTQSRRVGSSSKSSNIVRRKLAQRVACSARVAFGPLVVVGAV